MGSDGCLEPAPLLLPIAASSSTGFMSSLNESPGVAGGEPHSLASTHW